MCVSKDVNLGSIMCFGEEDGISYEVYLNKDNLYTIIVEKNRKELVETYQAERVIFDYEDSDFKRVNEKIDKMIKQLRDK